MSHRSRLDRRFSALTAEARAALVLRYRKRGLKPDEAIWSTMPDEDRAHFGWCIDLIRAVNEQAPYILLVREWVGALDARYEVVSTRRRLGEDMRALGAYIRESMREPATESEYRCREQELRAELVPVDELVEVAIDNHARGVDADYMEHAGKRVMSDDASTRARSETREELVDLFRRGTLKGEDQDTGIHINAGSFYEWLGEPMPVWSASACEYEIFPDSQAKEVASRQRSRRSVEELITGAPGGADLPLALGDPFPEVVPPEMAYAMLERMDVIALRDGIRVRWRELRCFEIVLRELAAKEFNGEDPLRVETRKVLREIKKHLITLREEMQLYGGDFELPEPDPGAVKQLRETIERRAKR